MAGRLSRVISSVLLTAAVLCLCAFTGQPLQLQESSALDEWAGTYWYYETPPKEHSGYNEHVRINLVIYQEAEAYFGYLNMQAQDDAYEYCSDRILAEIRGTQDRIELYFAERFANTDDVNGVLDAVYQKGDLLFSLQRQGKKIEPLWEKMTLFEQKEMHERGFVREDDYVQMILTNAQDEAHFLRAYGIAEKTEPFFQHYDDDGSLRVKAYYDMEKASGMSVFYAGDAMVGNRIGAYTQEVWLDTKFADIAEEHAKEGYEEHRVFNKKGQLKQLYTERTVKDSASPELDRAVEIEFFYRQDGTLKCKHCYYNMHLFGTTRSSQTHYYDAGERLILTTAYITHGGLLDFYIYEGMADTPSYRLTMDPFWNPPALTKF